MNEVIIGDGQWEKKIQIDYKEVEYLEPRKEKRWHVGDVEFDGHHTLWGFEYFPTTYLKSSGLSGDEYRKGGEIRYFRDRKQVYSEFCREPLLASNKIGATLLKLMDFDWNSLGIGKKVWYRELPCVVTMIIEEQGCVILERENKKDFPNDVWHKEEQDGDMGKGKSTVKVDVIQDPVFWYRS
jgi:hypothetical protein